MVRVGLRLFPNKKDCLILDFGSKTHSLCGVASSNAESEQNERTKGKLSEFAKRLPPTINKKLRAAIVEFDLLGEEFTWMKDVSTYYLKAIEGKVLKIFQTKEGRYNVVFFNGNNPQTIARDMSFEYTLSAEGFVKDNRALFTLSDLEANWRGLPISDKQKDLFLSFGYRSGIEIVKEQAANW